MSDSPAPLSREIPTTIHTEAVKGLFAIHGGACTAMLVFLASIWDKAVAGKPLVPYILVALMLFAVGLSVAGWINFVRAKAAVEWEGVFLHGASNTRAVLLTSRFRMLAGLSLVLFIVGVLVLAIGAARTLL